jgi:hypothetical protein
VVTVRGRVADRRFEAGGKYAVDIEVWGENQRGELVVRGAVTAQLFYSAEDETRQRNGQPPLVVTQAEEEERLAKLSRSSAPARPAVGTRPSVAGKIVPSVKPAPSKTAPVKPAPVKAAPAPARPAAAPPSRQAPRPVARPAPAKKAAPARKPAPAKKGGPSKKAAPARKPAPRTAKPPARKAAHHPKKQAGKRR